MRGRGRGVRGNGAGNEQQVARQGKTAIHSERERERERDAHTHRYTHRYTDRYTDGEAYASGRTNECTCYANHPCVLCMRVRAG